MGDNRTHEFVLAVRAVQTTDFMTADWFRMPHEVLDAIASRVVWHRARDQPRRLRHHVQAPRHDRVGVSDPPGSHMTPEEFRRHGRAVVDWIADYLRAGRALPGALAGRSRGRSARSCRAQPPATGRAVRRDARGRRAVILPGITHWQSPNFFAYFPANTPARRSSASCSRPGSACRGCSGRRARPAPSWKPTCSTGWSEMLGLPAEVPVGWRGRRRHPGHRLERRPCARCSRRASGRPASQRTSSGADGRLVAYASTQAHSSIEKAVKIAGLGRDNLRLDRRGRAASPWSPTRSADADRRRPARRADVPASSAPPSARRPPTRSTRCRRSGRICREHGVWLHVDAAMPAPPRSARSSAGSTTASSRPTATASTRTSGCSPTSTATASGSPIARP